MRNLQTSDIFSMCRLLTKIGVRDEIREIAERAEESKTKKIKLDFGFDLFFGILEKATQANAENEIYIFIADILECDPQQVRIMNPLDLFKQLNEAISFEEWKVFFKCVAKSMKMK